MDRDRTTRTGARAPGVERLDCSHGGAYKRILPDTEQGIRMQQIARRTQANRFAGKGASDIPALKPYRGKPAVRNFRRQWKRRHHSKPGPRHCLTRQPKNNRPNCLILKQLRARQGASRFGPVIFSVAEVCHQQALATDSSLPNCSDRRQCSGPKDVSVSMVGAAFPAELSSFRA